MYHHERDTLGGFTFCGRDQDAVGGPAYVLRHSTFSDTYSVEAVERGEVCGVCANGCATVPVEHGPRILPVSGERRCIHGDPINSCHGERDDYRHEVL